MPCPEECGHRQVLLCLTWFEYAWRQFLFGMNSYLAFPLLRQRTQPCLKPGFAGIERGLPIILENGHAGSDSRMIEPAVIQDPGLFILQFTQMFCSVRGSVLKLD